MLQGCLNHLCKWMLMDVNGKLMDVNGKLMDVVGLDVTGCEWDVKSSMISGLILGYIGNSC